MMPAILAIIGLFILLPVIYVVTTYNVLISLRNHIRDAWANVDTELKRRYDLIPQLVSTVKGYAAHEQAVLEKVTQLRTQCMASNGKPVEQAIDETKLVKGLRNLMAVVENYPDLKADEHFLELQKELVNTEDRLQAARRFYNGNIRDYRNKCEKFPSSIIANMFSFEKEDYFTVEPAVRETPDVSV